MEVEDITDPDFWESIYASGAPPWDKGVAAPPLVRAIGALAAPKLTRVLVPGCGFGHEALHLARHGFAVTAVDFAPAAVVGLRQRAAAEGVDMVVEQHDLFDLPAALDHAFDVLVEHTCFCAIPLSRRPDYAEVAARVLVDSGLLLGLFFEVDGEPDDGPPFPTTPDDVRRHFGPAFELARIEQPDDSFAERQGREWLAHLRRRTCTQPNNHPGE